MHRYHTFACTQNLVSYHKYEYYRGENSTRSNEGRMKIVQQHDAAESEYFRAFMNSLEFLLSDSNNYTNTSNMVYQKNLSIKILFANDDLYRVRWQSYTYTRIFVSIEYPSNCVNYLKLNYIVLIKQVFFFCSNLF